MHAVDFCAGSRRGKLDLASVVEMEGESGGALAKKNKYLCKFNNSWTEEFNVLSQSHVNNSHTFCKVFRTDFNIGHGGENAISQHIISQWYIRAAEAQKGSTKHTMLMLCTMLQCNVG